MIRFYSPLTLISKVLEWVAKPQTNLFLHSAVHSLLPLFVYNVSLLMCYELTEVIFITSTVFNLILS